MEPYKWLRQQSQNLKTKFDPFHDADNTIFSVPFSNSMNDDELAITAALVLPTRPRGYHVNFLTHVWLKAWKKTGREVLEQAIENLYAKTFVQLKFMEYGALSRLADCPTTFFQIYYGVNFDAERLLLPYLFMPLQRRSDGDFVVLCKCDENLDILSAVIIGLNDVVNIAQMSQLIARRSALAIQLYLYTSKINQDGDCDRDDWMLTSIYQPVFELKKKILSSLSKSEKVLFLLFIKGVETAITNANGNFGKAKNDLKLKHPEASTVIEEYFTNNITEKNLFHLFSL
ncbi:hypothetical protein HK098_004631 [Nowakowskiella sp. JEL0407]|nr:hypothetical protein HK098_004631 [Nowakowskiella sp. JEL0407]